MSYVKVSYMVPPLPGHSVSPKSSIMTSTKPQLLRLSLNTTPARAGPQRLNAPSKLPALNTSRPSLNCSIANLSSTGGHCVSRPRGSSSARPRSCGLSDVPNVSEIIPGKLYISDLSFAENPVYLTKYGITHILSTLQDSVSIPPPSVLSRKINHKQVYVADFPFAELSAHLPETTSFITNAISPQGDHKNGRNNIVLVHCHEGISRSTSVVSAYLMHRYGMSPQDALAYVKSKRKIAEPNSGFVQQLHEYARDKLGQKSTSVSPLHPGIPSPHPSPSSSALPLLSSPSSGPYLVAHRPATPVSFL